MAGLFPTKCFGMNEISYFSVDVSLLRFTSIREHMVKYVSMYPEKRVTMVAWIESISAISEQLHV